MISRVMKTKNTICDSLEVCRDRVDNCKITISNIDNRRKIYRTLDNYPRNLDICDEFDKIKATSIFFTPDCPNLDYHQESMFYPVSILWPMAQPFDLKFA